jgi:hypothetical protein
MRIIVVVWEWRDLLDRWREGDARGLEHSSTWTFYIIPQ